ncbi:Uncharacterised protein [Legionella feeleii]|uniref:Uncharacterized protein n=1 Tax=Legionella feeleii TaxID=453 RepID=A0A2X1QVC5_9GAMM|nr:Uncharacterised protein [Legionella feeleii]STX36985.1 Uncharacterised protein [Legionella feeleii]
MPTSVPFVKIALLSLKDRGHIILNNLLLIPSLIKRIITRSMRARSS